MSLTTWYGRLAAIGALGIILGTASGARAQSRTPNPTTTATPPSNTPNPTTNATPPSGTPNPTATSTFSPSTTDLLTQIQAQLNQLNQSNPSSTTTPSTTTTPSNPTPSNTSTQTPTTPITPTITATSGVSPTVTAIENLSTLLVSEFDLKIKQPTNAWVFMAQVTQLYAANAAPPAAGMTLTPAQDMANIQSLVQYMDANFDLGIDQPAEAFLFIYWVGILYQANIRPLIVAP